VARRVRLGAVDRLTVLPEQREVSGRNGPCRPLLQQAAVDGLGPGVRRSQNDRKRQDQGGQSHAPSAPPGPDTGR